MAKIRTSSGRMVDPFDIKPEDIELGTMVRSICMLNRYTGHTKHPYSVGQHTLALARNVPRQLIPVALVHDLAESWFNDLAYPVKIELPEYSKMESKAEKVIYEKFNISPEDVAAFKDYDRRIYVDERNYLYDNVDELGTGDDLVALGITKPMAKAFFSETPWRVTALELAYFIMGQIGSDDSLVKLVQELRSDLRLEEQYG